MKLETCEAANRRHISALGNLEGKIAVGDGALPAGEACTMSYRTRLTLGGAETTFSTRQYYLVEGDKAYVVKYTTLPGLADEYAGSFIRSARSFELR